MKNHKLKSSLLTITLISTSLFGSWTDVGTLNLQPEKTQKDVLPSWARRTMNVFNMLPEVQALKNEYDSLQNTPDAVRVNSSRALASKQHTNNRIAIMRKTVKTTDLYIKDNEMFINQLKKNDTKIEFKRKDFCFLL